jgi:hypothetical protein
MMSEKHRNGGIMEMTDKNEALQNSDALDQVTGGRIAKNPKGSSDTDDKYLVVNDNTKEVIAKTGGYGTARKIAAALGQSSERIEPEDIRPHSR